MIDARKDGTIRMSVRVSVPRALQKGEEKNEWRAPTAKDLFHDARRIRTKVTGRDLSDDAMSRREFSFSTSRSLLRRVSDDDQGMFLPYPDGKHQWVFVFRAAQTGSGDPTAKPPSANSQNTAEELATALLSSATYRVFFRGVGQPRMAAFTGLDGKRAYLRVTAFGDSSVIDVPIIMLARGGVLTTATYWQIDFKRTDRLIAFLKSLGPATIQPSGKEESTPSDDADQRPSPGKDTKPSSGKEVSPVTDSDDQPAIPSPSK